MGHATGFQPVTISIAFRKQSLGFVGVEPGECVIDRALSSPKGPRVHVPANRTVETGYLTRMTTANFNAREYGHTGQGFSYLWGPPAESNPFKKCSPNTVAMTRECVSTTWKYGTFVAFEFLEECIKNVVVLHTLKVLASVVDGFEESAVNGESGAVVSLHEVLCTGGYCLGFDALDVCGFPVASISAQNNEFGLGGENGRSKAGVEFGFDIGIGVVATRAPVRRSLWL